MVTLESVDQQLKAIGVKVRFWNRPEVLELRHILLPGETIEGAVSGRYEGGLAMLFVTDQRILLIDKKLLHLSVEDLRYDMISEVDYGAQLLSGTVRICTPTKVLAFTGFKPQAVRAIASFIQQRVIEIRQQFAGQQQPQQAFQQQPPAPVQKIGIPQAPFIDPRQAKPEVGSAPLTAQQPVATPLLTPQLGRNPYTTTPLMIRRRIGRFGSFAQSHS